MKDVSKQERWKEMKDKYGLLGMYSRTGMDYEKVEEEGDIDGLGLCGGNPYGVQMSLYVVRGFDREVEMMEDARMYGKKLRMVVQSDVLVFKDEESKERWEKGDRYLWLENLEVLREVEL